MTSLSSSNSSTSEHSPTPPTSSKSEGPPYCPGCGVPIPRLHQFCQPCKSRLHIQQAECTCYSDGPADCKSELEHDCCCVNADEVADCRAPGNQNKHRCICALRPSEDRQDCRAFEHDCTCRSGVDSDGGMDDEDDGYSESPCRAIKHH
jgi:hypothetical protein